MLLVTPLVFDRVPDRLRGGRPLLLGLVGVALVLFLLEWLVIH